MERPWRIGASLVGKGLSCSYRVMVIFPSNLVATPIFLSCSVCVSALHLLAANLRAHGHLFGETRYTQGRTETALFEDYYSVTSFAYKLDSTTESNHYTVQEQPWLWEFRFAICRELCSTIKQVVEQLHEFIHLSVHGLQQNLRLDDNFNQLLVVSFAEANYLIQFWTESIKWNVLFHTTTATVVSYSFWFQHLQLDNGKDGTIMLQQRARSINIWTLSLSVFR